MQYYSRYTSFLKKKQKKKTFNQEQYEDDPMSRLKAYTNVP